MMARFSSKDLLEVRDQVEPFLTRIRDMPPEEKVRECLHVCGRPKCEEQRGDRAEEPGAPLFNRLHALAMFFAEIGVSLESHLIDKREFSIFDRLVPYYWTELAPFIVACHLEFGFPLEERVPLHEQSLRLFEKFRLAYVTLLETGIAVEPSMEKRFSEPPPLSTPSSVNDPESHYRPLEHRRSQPRPPNPELITRENIPSW